MVKVAAVSGSVPVRCGVPVEVGDASLVVRDFRLFLSEVELQTSGGDWVPLKLGATPWQTESVALLDFEDGCHNGTAETNTVITGSATGGPHKAMRATVGVGFEENHADPLLAEPPLTTTSMHWSWQAGYKFLRLDVVVDGEARRLHLGSAGCEGPMGAVSKCSHPNRAQLELPLKGGQASLDVQPLLEAAVASKGCMGTPGDEGCRGMLKAMGLSEGGKRVGKALSP